MTNSARELIDKLNQLIANSFNNSDFSSDSVCLELGVSRSQLYRLLKEEFQLSPSIYIRKRKLLIAKELLATTELKIAEVAYHIGMDSPQNFTKYFTKEYGISPTEFRKNLPTRLKNLNEEVQTPIPKYIEQEIITETKTERTIEEKITIEQRITEAITERKVQKVIEMPMVKIPQRLYYLLYFLVFCVLVLSGFFIWQMTTKQADTPASKGIVNPYSSNFIGSSYQKATPISIAILPFKNLGKSEHNIFCDGIMEQIHSALSQLENLKVISKTSSNQFRNTQKAIPQIAADLHVSHILEGSIMQIDSHTRMVVRLIHTKEDKVIWTKSYDADVTKELFTYMNTVAKEVATELNQKLSQIESKKLDKIPTINLKAYNEYLQAKELMLSRNKEKLEASLLKLYNAIHLDSSFADAYANLALAYFLLGDGNYIEIAEAYKMAEKNALTAIKIDSENALAYANLANIYRDQNKWEQANTTYQIALKYSPSNALINYWYSLMLRTLGRLDEAIKYSTKAVSLDPLNHIIMGGHIYNYIFTNQLDLAEKAIKEGELLFNMSWTHYWVRGHLNFVKGDYAKALEEYSKSQKLNPHVKSITYHLMLCKAKLGKTKEVKDYLQSLVATPDNYTGFIIIHAGLGDKESAIAYLQKDADAGYIPSDLKILPFYQILRNDKRYEAVLQKFGLSDTKKTMQ
jgi:TolB-like protein/AraC-like DNA-binding protein